MTNKPRIAFLGIGLMGLPMARHLVAAGYPVTAWNRTRAKAEALGGAAVADTPQAAAQGAEVIITMLENGPIVEKVLFGEAGVRHGISPDALVIDMSSIRPSEARDHAARLVEVGAAYLDAPVSGGTVGAEAASLAIMCGGDEAAFVRAEPVLREMGNPVHVGPVGSGQVAKLANQMIVGITIGAVAEALALAARFGADPARVREALRGGFAESRVLDLHGQRMVERDFETKGRTATQIKDLENALATAEGLSFTSPLLTQATTLFQGLAEHEGDPDHSALILEIERLNAG
ncbi:NAD(P)-dependent oxidoreductase [Ruegeria sediminis]|uniref:NAD(P)-dependent oxidoreductase n=1 Tax=Ruegeria sediminis TaxID=2583820 RepID=A0ABY2X4P8_9RHOB|nr:NAD(P)-dependent oxidoreductase [Ruegeria sediminis]TMV09939.1 NAD(P)-dependent oxidoreductase [Ruegeria sediminis]